MSTEAMDAEKMRRKRLVQLVGTCQECGTAGEGRPGIPRASTDGIKHALCFYEPDFAKRARESAPKTNG